MSDTDNNKPAIASLFSAYDQAQAAREAADQAVAAANTSLSEAVEAIAENYGKGPYRREGSLLTAVKRENKKSQTTTWFFKTRNEGNAIEVG